MEGKGADIRIKIARRVAQEIKDGAKVNLGIGIPTLVSAFVNPEFKIELHGENGVFGISGYPKPGDEHPDLMNAGRETIKISNRASFFSSSDSFGMVRGGHIDCTILGAMQVSGTGDIANWIIPEKLVKGMGGAMDLVSSRSNVIVAMEHTTKGAHKILEKCTLPLTGKACVTQVITEMAVFDFSNNGKLTLKEIADGLTIDHVKKATGAKFESYPQINKF